MIRILMTAVIGLTAVAANAQQSFVINGKLSGKHNGQKVFLEYRNAAQECKDSAVITNGRFAFKGAVGAVTKAYLTLKPLTEPTGPVTVEQMLARNYQDFYLENARYIVAGENIYKAKITGGTVQQDYNKLRSALATKNAEVNQLSEAVIRQNMGKNWEDADTGQTDLAKKLQSAYFEIASIQDAFIHKHPDSYVSLHLLNERNEGPIDPGTFEPYFKALSPRMQNTAIGKELAKRLQLAKTVDVGQQAPDFTLPDTQDHPISLSSLKGKYVLVDFWASWCSPCRAEHPEVLKAYQHFKDRNFEIIAVSLDDKKEPWLKAIKADGLPWLQVSDLKGFQNAAAILYGVKSVPQNFLLDPEGKIIAKNMRGQELHQELDKIFNK